MSRAAIFATAYFPSIEYLYEIHTFEQIKIEQYETYPKQTFRNRMVLNSANGLLSLSVPVKRVNGNHTLTKDVRIDRAEHWNRKHWKALESAYANSPFFEYYAPEIKDIIDCQDDFLIDLNERILLFFSKRFRLNLLSVARTSSFEALGGGAYDVRFLSDKHDVAEATLHYPYYKQVFDERNGFSPQVSALDLLFNLGPEATSYLKALQLKIGKNNI